MVSVEAAPQSGMMKGFYNKHSSTQASAVTSCTGLLRTASQQVPIHSSALHIAEWGCAHGGNSIAPVYTISEALNQRMEACSWWQQGAAAARDPH